MYTFDKFGISYHHKLLSNGAEIRLLQKQGAPIHIQACMRCGSRYNDTPGQAHLFEHMIVAGTKNHPSKSSLAGALETVGGYLDATTDPDFIRLTVSIPDTKHLSLAASLLGEMLTESLFDEGTFRNEQKTVLHEMQEQKRNRSRQVTLALLSQLYPDSQQYADGLGTPESVSAMELDDMRTFADKHLTSNRITFIVSGDVDSEKVESELETIALKQSDTNTPVPKFHSQNAQTEIEYDAQSDSPVDIAAGFRCEIDTVDELAGLILIQQLFMCRKSPFIEALRYKQALVYSGKTLVWDYAGTCVFSVHTSSMAKHTSTIFEIMHSVFTSVSDSGITNEQLNTLKVKTESHYRFNLQTSQQWLDAEVRALRQKSETQTEVTSLSVLSSIQNMDADKLTRVYRKFFTVENMSKVVIDS